MALELRYKLLEKFRPIKYDRILRRAKDSKYTRWSKTQSSVYNFIRVDSRFQTACLR